MTRNNTRNNKGRDRWHGDATPKQTTDRNHTETDALVGWFSLGKRAIKRQQKRKGGAR